MTTSGAWLQGDFFRGVWELFLKGALFTAAPKDQVYMCCLEISVLSVCKCCPLKVFSKCAFTVLSICFLIGEELVHLPCWVQYKLHFRI